MISKSTENNDESRHAPTTVLVIDDEPAIIRLLSMWIRKWGYRVLSAGGGDQGLAIFDTEPVDLVITDLFMPQTNGFEVLKKIQRNAPDTPVIVLSGQGALGDAIRALRLGAWDYIYKPVEERDVLRFAIERDLDKARLLKENRRYRNHLEQVVAEKSVELLENEKRYRTVADFTYDWEYWIDPDGRLLYVSPSCQRVTGYMPQEISQDPALLETIILDEDRSLFVQHINDNSRIEGVCDIDFRIQRRDGKTRWIGHRCQEVRGPEGEYLGRRCSNRDITYQKEMEQTLIRQKHDLINKTIELERVNAAFQKANEALKALLDQREVEKRSIEQTMVANLKKHVYPYLDELEKPRAARESAFSQAVVSIIRTNIDQLVSPVSQSLSGAYQNLTPTEIKIADFIRQGVPTKTIADILGTSPGTVATHRNKIRKKLNILNKKINLRTYLSSLL